MPAFISMLRGINVAGQNQLRMPELKSLYERLGFTNVTTYLQSGNVVFESAGQPPLQLSETIEAQITASFGLEVRVFVRAQGDFGRMIAANPFLTGRQEDTARLHVTFLYSVPPPQKMSALVIAHDPADEFILKEEEIYLFCPNGYGKTKLSNTAFERKLGVPATTRNWNTVTALYALAKSLG